MLMYQSSASRSPIRLAPFVGRAVVSPLHIFSIFTNSLVPRDAWVYFWNVLCLFYLFVCLTVLFGLLELCGLSWNQVLWYLQLKSFCSRLLWLFRPFHGPAGMSALLFPVLCKNVIGVIMDMALSLYIILITSDVWLRQFIPFFCVNLFRQCFVIFSVKVFHSLG